MLSLIFILGLPSGMIDKPDFQLTSETYDTDTLPHLNFSEKASEATVETVEQDLQYYLSPMFRDDVDRENGSIPAWRGPEQDRIVLL